MLDETEEIIKKAAEPHLVASAKDAYFLLERLNAIISDLRLDTSETELKCDLALNELFKGSLAIEKAKAEWRVSPIYREWKDKAGKLTDLRAIRRNLERHSELLSSQERFGRKTSTYTG